MGQSSVLTSVRQIYDSRPQPPVEDSVGQTSFTGVGLESSSEEDGWVRPRSVNLLRNSRVIDSKEPEKPDIQEKGDQCRPWNRCSGEGPIIIQSLRSSSAFRVRLSVNGMGIEATVDTAADVAIVADHMWRKLELPPPPPPRQQFTG